MPADYDKLFRPASDSDSEDDAAQTFFDPNASYPPAAKGNGDAAPPIDWSQPIPPPTPPAAVEPTAPAPPSLPPMPIGEPTLESLPPLPPPPQFSFEPPQAA